MFKRTNGDKFRKKMKGLRQELGMSQTEFANSLGIHWNTYANYERGRLTIPMELMGELVKVYNVDLNDWVLED